MSWLDAPARLFCALSGGHDFYYYKKYAVCEYCGKRVALGGR